VNNVICPGCGHTTKPGLVNEEGLCPICAGPVDEGDSNSGDGED